MGSRTLHYSEIDRSQWDRFFPNFSPKEFACPCCGELVFDIELLQSVSMLQAARTYLGLPIKVNSAHRCAIHNARVGGAAKSMHKRIAFDLSTRGIDRLKLLKALKRAGFTTFGLYNTFIHTDIRPGRRWYGSDSARKLWNQLLA